MDSSPTEDAPLHEPWVLVTGCGPFPGVEVNPTGAICAALDGELIEGHRVRGRALLTSFEDTACALESLILNEHPPALVLLTGVDIKATSIRLEIQARNWIAGERQDATGAEPGPCPITEQAAPRSLLETPFGWGHLVYGLLQAGYPAEPSGDAGAYVCNFSYYQALMCGLKSGSEAVFLHLPQVGSAWGDRESQERAWSLSDLTDATLVALRAMISARTALIAEAP